jgi:hypothetical protein
MDLSAGIIDKQPIDLSAGVVESSKPNATATAAQSAANQHIDLSAGIVSESPKIDLSAGIVGATPAPTTPTPQGRQMPTGEIKPWNLSVWDRIERVFRQGIPNYSTRTVHDPNYGKTQLLSPADALTPGEQRQHPILTGAAEVAGGLSSPESIALIAGTGGLGELPGAAAMLPRLLSAGFGAQAIYQAAQTYPEIKAAIKKGDLPETERLLTHAVLDISMAGLAARHAATGKGAVSGKTETAETNEAAVETRPIEPTSPLGELLHEQKPDASAPGVRLVDSSAAKDALLNDDTVPVKETAPKSISDSPATRPEADRSASVTASPDIAQLRAPRVVKNSYRPVVSQSEVLSEAVQRMINNSKELQNAIDPSKINSPADIETALAQSTDHIQRNLDPRISATISFDAQKQLASELGMTVEELLSRKSGQAFNAEQAIAARAFLNDSGLYAVKAARNAVVDKSLEPEMGRAIARHQEILTAVKGMTAEAGRALGSFNIHDLPASRLAEAMSKLSEPARAKAAELLSKLDTDNPRQVNDFIEKITPNSTADKLFEFYRNARLSGPQVAIYKGLSEASMVALETTKKLVASGLSKDRYAAEAYWFAKGAIDALQHTKDILTDEFTLADAPEFEKVAAGHQQAIKGIAGDIIRFPSTLLSRQANLAYVLNYKGELNAQAARIALKEGLSGAELAARQEWLTQNPTKAMTDAAHQMGLHNTFQRDLGKFGKSALSTLDKDPTGIFRYIYTFRKTPINLVKESSYYSPYGLFKGALTGDIDLQAKGLVGSILASGVAYLAANGLVTGGGPVNAKQRETLEATGWQSYSLKLGGRYYSYRKMEPLGMMFALVSDAIHGMRIGDSTEVTQSKADTALRHIMNSLRDAAFLPALSEVSQALTNPDYGWKRAFNNQVAGFVPAVVQDVAHATDPTVRRPTDLIQTIESRIPGLTNRVPATIGIDGKPMQRPASALGGANPFPVSTSKNDPVTTELARLGVSTSEAPATMKRRGRVTPLTDSQRQLLSEQEGQQLHEILTRIIDRKGWQSLSDENKRKSIARFRREIEQARPARIARLAKNQ